MVGVVVKRELTCLDSLLTSLTSLYPTKGRKISKDRVNEYKRREEEERMPPVNDEQKKVTTIV